MIVVNKIKKYKIVFCYIISLLTIFLPWCYFDKEVDSINYGIDLVNNRLLIFLAVVTFLCMIFIKGKEGKMITSILLSLHFVLYLFAGLFWYVPLITDFNLFVSLDAAHCGFYLSLLCTGFVYWLNNKSVP